MTKKNSHFQNTDVSTDSPHSSDEYHVRIQKVNELAAHHIPSWPATPDVANNCLQVIKEFEQEQEKKVYTIAGRIMTLRLHGKASFATLQDVSGRLQVYVREDVLGNEKFALWSKYIDMGDIVWFKGTSFKTKTGEITLRVDAFELLSKSLHPLPEKFHGISDIEVKYRQRYLDIITSPEAKERFVKRTKILKNLRAYLDSHGYIEVETPMLHPIAGGAAARPFITHHNALDSDFYLRIAPELYLKRLVVGGFDKVYEINRNFRNEGISTRHNPEFTMVEFYTAYKDYHYIMAFVEDMLRTIVKEVCNTTTVQFGEYTIDFGTSFTRMSIRDAVKKYVNLTESDLSQDTIDATLKKYSVKLAQKNAVLGQKVYALFEELVEKKLIQPTFITDFPIEVSPLAKRDEKNTEIAARCELFIAGMEISNAFNELNDPFDQAERFKQQLEAHKAGDEEAHQYDADYILALEHALPPTVGVGIGIDRLIMLLTNTTSIKDVILFPTLKKQH